MERQIRDSSKWAYQVLHPEKRIIEKICLAEKRTIANQSNGVAILIVGSVTSVYHSSNEVFYIVGEISCYGAVAPGVGDLVLVNGVVTRPATLNGCVFRTMDSYAASSAVKLAASDILSGHAKSIPIPIKTD